MLTAYRALVDLPNDYESLLKKHPNGLQEMHDGAYIDIWGRTRAEAARDDAAYEYLHDHYPGLVIIGSDGASEMIGYDTRKDPPPVVLVNVVSEGWHEACWQATSLSELLTDLRSGKRFRFETDYESPSA